MKRKVLFPFFGKKDLPAGMKMFLLLLAVFLWSENTFSQNWNQLVKTVAADRTAGVHLGSSVAISGDYAIVGAPQDGSGSAYIFQRIGANWVQMQKIVASDADSDDNFGTSVAISGDYVVVGAVYDNGDATNTSFSNDAGSAYIFKRTGATWAQEQKIVASDRQNYDYFGFSVAISGDYVVVGAFLQDLDASGSFSASDGGAAYIFTRTGTTWSQQQKIVASDGTDGDGFGYAVSISGDYVVATAIQEDENAAGTNTILEAGSAYVFFRTGTIWSEQQKVVASDRAADDNFGRSVAISGDYVIIGTPFEDEDAAGGNTLSEAGSAYIFTRTGTTWAQQQKIVASDRGANDHFAYSVSISGNYAMIGSYYEDENASGTGTLFNSGSAYIFGRSGTTWIQNNKIVASDRAADDNFGKSVAISGDYAIVGSPYEDEDAAGANTIAETGSAYFFKNCGTITGTTTVTNVSCNNGTNGTINLTPSGGAAAYTYSWGGGITTEDRTGLGAGSYSVTITDANGCIGTVSGITITQPTGISASTIVTNVACNAGTTGAINLTPSGGTPGYTFNWGGGITTEDRTGLAAGTYAVIITDANGCTRNITGVTVTQPTAISGTTVVTNVACNSGTNGAINLSPSGGTPGYTFSWGGGITTEDRTGLAAGTYAVTITDANACTRNITGITVTQPTAISVTPNTQSNVSCFGGVNGAAAINTPSGGTPGYTYNWTPGTPTGDGTVSVTGLSAGTWTCTVTDANGCVASRSFTVTQPPAISVTASSQTNVSCNGGSNGAAAINIPTGGAGGYAYNWTPGNPTGDGTTSITGITAGTWTCTVTDANGCTASQSFTVTQPTAISVTASSQTNVSCNGGSNGAAAVNTPTGGTPGYTYNWTPGTPTGDGTTSITGIAAGTWTCTVTDANGCVASQSFTVTQPTAISLTASSQTNVSCNGGSNGAAAVNTPTGGTPGYTYNWTPGTPTGDGTTSITGIAAGTWTCTVTDANGCTASQSFTVTQPTAISVTASSQTNVSCNGGSNGAAAVNTPTGGTPGYTYDWAPGTPTGDGTTSITGIAAGTWICTVTDANGCVASQSFTVTQPTAISLTASSQTNVSCNGGSNGTAAVNTPTGGTPGYTYNWTPGTPTGDGTTSITGISAGTWTCTVTDANGCVASQSFTVTQPTAISLTASSQTNVSCNGGSNGAATVNTPTGGTPGYTYDWTPGTPTGDGTTSITGIAAGTWTCNVMDANGCMTSQSFTVSQPAAITNTVSTTSCDSYTLNGTTYTTSGTYTQVLTSVSGCDSTLTLNLTINNSTTETLSATSCSSYTLNGTTYTSSGTYTQALTNAVGCDSILTLNLIITQPTSATLTETACDSYTLNGNTYTTSGTYAQTLMNAAGCDSTLTLILTINTSTVSILTETECESFTLNGSTYTSTGVYTQVLENAAGCDSTITLNLTINNSTASTLADTACESYTLNGQTYTASGIYTQLLTNSVGCDSILTLALTINSADADTTTATACGSYLWNGQTFTASGFYTLSYTNANGCDSIENLDLTILPSPVAGITSLSVVSLQASGTGTYQWINCSNGQPIGGETNAIFTAASNGSYAVIVSNGSCSDTSNCFVISQVGLEENNASFGVTLTPNPTQNDVKITFTGAHEASIVIYDAQGKTVMTVYGIQSGEMLSTQAFERGVYMVNIMTTSGNHTERLVKQ